MGIELSIFVSNTKTSCALNLKDIRKSMRLTQDQFGYKIGVSQAMISAVERGDTPMPYDWAEKIKAAWNVEVDIVSEPSEHYKSIPVVETEIFATISPAMSDVVTLQPSTFINIPMFSRGEYAISVTGSSMKGFINSGDMAVIRKIHHVDKIIYGECYVIITRGDNLRTIKFVNEDKDNPHKLWLSPYNIEQFQSQSIEKTDILEMYQVIGIFRRVGS